MTSSSTKSSKFVLPDAAHIGPARLRVADLDRALAFYRDLLGYEATAVEDRVVRLSPRVGAAAHLLLEQAPGVPPKPWRTAGLFHLAIRLPTRRDLARVILRLQQHHWRIAGSADHGVSEAFYLNDPDGNGLEIYRDRPRSEWPFIDGSVAMVSDPLDLRSMFATLDAGDVDITSLPTTSDIGHIHLQVSDLGRAEAFYVDILGFAVMQRSYQGALFVSAGGYHHHIGLNVWAGEGIPAVRHDVAGLIDFTVLLPDSDTLDTVETRILQSGLQAQRSTDGSGSPTLQVHDSDGIGVILAVDAVN